MGAEFSNLGFDIDYLSRLFSYKDGKLLWNKRPLSDFKTLCACNTWNSRFVGKEAGRIGYYNNKTIKRWIICIDYRQCLRSVIVWAIHRKEYPNMMIDHKDNDQLNDKIDNLRLATRSQNFGNKRINKNNKCGFKGVNMDKKHGTYNAEICVNRVRTRLSGFKTPEEAHAAYMEMANKQFGEFANPGWK
jgi:HNH endonuclease